MLKLNNWCTELLTNKLFKINKVKHPEWHKWSVHKNTINHHTSITLTLGDVSYVLVLI